jgi:hypothetical protein
VYHVTASEESLTFETRKAAIVAAKDMSTDARGTVDVYDNKERELLRFRDGGLELCLFETRPGKSVLN